MAKDYTTIRAVNFQLAYVADLDRRRGLRYTNEAAMLAKLHDAMSVAGDLIRAHLQGDKAKAWDAINGAALQDMLAPELRTK